MEEIKIIIAKDGKVTIDVEGIKGSGCKGSGCKDLTKKLEKALGSSKSKKKAEYYDEQDVGDNQGVGGY
jgi:hypothetical protein